MLDIYALDVGSFKHNFCSVLVLHLSFFTHSIYVFTYASLLTLPPYAGHILMLSLPLFSFRCRARETRGIFPKSYVHLCEYNIVNGEYCIQRTDIVEEITKVMLEWGSIAKSYFLVSTYMKDVYNSKFT